MIFPLDRPSCIGFRDLGNRNMPNLPAAFPFIQVVVEPSILCLVLLLNPPQERAATPQETDEPNVKGTASFSKLIQSLGSADVEARELATQQLLSMGYKAKDPLIAAFKHPDLEVRARVRHILGKLDWQSLPVARFLENRTPRNKPKWVDRSGGGNDTEGAVLAALKWLARHQGGDGAWRVQEYVRECGKIATYGQGACLPNPGHDDFDAGVTGLSLLAFLGSGYSHRSKETYDEICFGDVVRKGLKWMMSRQDREGCIGSRNAQKYMYNHTICALAMSEAYGLTGSNLFKEQAQKSVDFLIAAQNPGKAWRYSFRCADNDTFVTYWATMALVVARHARLKVPPSAFEGARTWLNEVTAEDGHVGYTHKGTGRVFVPSGGATIFDVDDSLTAAAGILRTLTGNPNSQQTTKGMKRVVLDSPKWHRTKTDFVYWHLGSLALFQHEGPKGPRWKSWNSTIKKMLLGKQNQPEAGCKSGSWNPVDQWGGEGGRVYATAINALTLETYYRYRCASRD